jgi:hypothetical protein
VALVAGKHRRPEDRLPQVPDRMLSSTGGFFQPPASAAGPGLGAAEIWGSAAGGLLGLQASDRAGSPAANGLPARADSDWQVDPSGVSWPHWNAPPPMLHPDHPSAPVPRVREPRAPGPQGQVGPGRVPADNPGRPARPAAGPPPRQPGSRSNPGSVGPRANSQARASAPAHGQGYDPAQGYNSGHYPPTRANPPGSGYTSAPSYDPGPGYNPAQGYDPGAGYNLGQGYASARGYVPAQDYRPGPHYPPARGDQPARGSRRLYAVPDDARVAGPTDRYPDRGQMPAGQVQTVAEDHAAAITREAWDQATAIRRAAEQDAAAIRRQATSQAAAIRQAAEQDAAGLTAALLAMSGELGRVAAYVTDNLAVPLLPATRPMALPSPRPAAEPQVPPVTRPETRPATKPAVRPAKPETRPRQFKAIRLATAGAACLVLFAVAAGATQVEVHGYQFFVFRQGGTGSTGGNTTDDQFLAHQAAAHHAAKGRGAIGSQPARGRHALKPHRAAKAPSK